MYAHAGRAKEPSLLNYFLLLLAIPLYHKFWGLFFPANCIGAVGTTSAELKTVRWREMKSLGVWAGEMAENERWKQTEQRAHGPLGYPGTGHGLGGGQRSAGPLWSEGWESGGTCAQHHHQPRCSSSPSTDASRDAPGCLVTALKSKVPMDLWRSSLPSKGYE